jgi:DNA repair exonuclease SbcCD ATPase subunit
MASSNRCSVCPKGAGTCFCPGCKAYFCDKDFKQHREMLFNSLDELTVDRNDLQEKINKASSKKQFGSSLLSRIDEWQEITIGKVKQAAEQARQQALKIMNSKREEITRQFQTLSQELEQLRETEGVLEQDLARLKQQIGQLNKGLEQLSQPSVGELNVKQSDQIVWNRMIYVEEKSAHADYQQHRPQLRGQYLNRFYNEFFKHRFFH